ncbi:MAG: tetratricopeptide repeat protein, partial [Chitinophagales bacterium]
MRVPFIVFFAVSLFVFVSPNVLAEGALTPYGLQQETSHEDDDAPKKALKFYQKGVSAYNYQQFEEAKEWLNKAIKKYPNYTKAYAKLAEIYLAQKDFDEAKRVYKKIIKVSDTEENVFGVNFKLGKIEKDLGNYDAAGTHFQACLNTIVPAIRYWDRQKEKAAWHLKNCTFAAKAVKYPVKFEPIHLNSNINSKHDEYLPMLTADEEVLMFTRRFNHDTHPNEDFYLSITDTTGVWRQATDLGNLINTKENEGAICVSPDGKVLFFAAKNRPGDLNRGFDLYYCYKKGAEWSKPHNLGMPVNSYYWDSQPSVS